MYGKIVEKINYGAYICSSKLPTVKDHKCGLMNINMKFIESIVWKAVIDLLANSDKLMKSVKEYLLVKSMEVAGIHSEINGVNKQIESEKAAKKKLLELYLHSQSFSKDELDEMCEEYSAKIDQLNKKVKQLENQLEMVNKKSEVLNNVDFIRKNLLQPSNFFQ